MTTSKQTQDLTMQFQQLQQQLHSIMMQNEQANIQVMEIDKALSELKNSDDEVYKISGTILIKSTKDKVSKQMAEEKESLEIRVKTLQKHEATLKDKLKKVQEELMKVYGKQQENKADAE